MLKQLGLLAKDHREAEEASALAKRAICACGHEVLHHDKSGRCTYGHGTRFGGCTCKRRKPRGRLVVVQPPELEAPLDAVVLWRPDTKRPKTMGWALVGKSNVVVYLAQLKTKSPNVAKGGFTPRFFAIRARQIAERRERARAGVAQAFKRAPKCFEPSEPTKVVVTRISSGTLDDDNLGGALKPVRDGIADALGIDDARFSIEGREKKKIPLHYRQAKPGKRKVCGVRIELFWKGAG